jgi:trehalose/maltose hydrolase-like predicted phosphorylase
MSGLLPGSRCQPGLVNPLERTFDAVVLDGDAVAYFDGSAPALRDRLENLIARRVHVGLLSGEGSDELGGRLAVLAARGIPPESVLLVVDGHRPEAGSRLGCALVSARSQDDVLRLLDDQLRRRAERRVPDAPAHTAWSIIDEATHGRRSRAMDSVFTIGDGNVATHGSLDEDPAGASVLASGVYVGEGAEQHLLPGPGWTGLDLSNPHQAPSGRRVLDLRAGVLLREELTGDTPLRTARFASAARPGLQVLRAEGPTARLRAGPALKPPAEGGVETGQVDGFDWTRTPGDEAGILAVAVQTTTEQRDRTSVERLAVYRGDPGQPPPLEPAVAALRRAHGAGFDALLAEHRQVWAARWADVDVEIPDDPSAQLALRFALFQLWTNVGCPAEGVGPPERAGVERGVGARGLSGNGYAGHVFWDADVFVLPAMATLCPAAARAMLEYRIRRLPVARALAAASGRAGARFPWESARDGDEVTPSSIMLGSQLMAVRTGELEEHISADVAWAAEQYAAWTGDHEVLSGPARPLIVETARYWASRVRYSADGRAHIDRVIGPDEYHEEVDDNAFTNVMARWNLRRGADLVADPDEASSWHAVADALVDGYHPETGRHEQFAGYDRLRPLTVADVAADIPFAADLMLGRDVVTGSQLLKQADVLMAHFLVPQEMAPGSLGPDLDFYAPRTSHGSSLSPAITAGALARAGRADAALDMLRLALRLDLDDLTGSSLRGVHLATIGGVWQALVQGFVGLTVSGGVLCVEPQLPHEWGSVRLRLRCRGARLRVTVSADRFTLSTDRPLRMRTPGSPELQVTDQAQFVRTADGWRQR